jgi:hypothetical protein
MNRVRVSLLRAHAKVCAWLSVHLPTLTYFASGVLAALLAFPAINAPGCA